MPVAESTAANPLDRFVLKRQFGKIKKGNVVPRWFLANAGDVDEMLARKEIEETFLPVSVELKVAKEQAQMDAPPAEMVENENRLNIELAGLKSEREVLKAQIAELTETVKKRDESLSRLSDAHNAAEAKSAAELKKAKAAEQDAKKELKKVKEQSAGQVAALQKDLDNLRKPAPDATDAPLG